MTVGPTEPLHDDHDDRFHDDDDNSTDVSPDLQRAITTSSEPDPTANHCTVPLGVLLVGFSALLVLITMGSTFGYMTATQDQITSTERDSCDASLRLLSSTGRSSLGQQLNIFTEFVFKAMFNQFTFRLEAGLGPAEMLREDMKEMWGTVPPDEVAPWMRKKLFSMETNVYWFYSNLVIVFNDGAAYGVTNLPKVEGKCTLYCGELVPSNWSGTNDGLLYCANCSCSEGQLSCSTPFCHVSEVGTDPCWHDQGGYGEFWYTADVEAIRRTENLTNEEIAALSENSAAMEYQLWRRHGAATRGPESTSRCCLKDFRREAWFITGGKERRWARWDGPHVVPPTPHTIASRQRLALTLAVHNGYQEHIGMIKAEFEMSLLLSELRAMVPTRHSLVWAMSATHQLLIYSGNTSVVKDRNGEPTMSNMGSLYDPSSADWGTPLIHELSEMFYRHLNYSSFDELIAKENITIYSTLGGVYEFQNPGPPELHETQVEGDGTKWTFQSRSGDVLGTGMLSLALLVPDDDIMKQFKIGTKGAYADVQNTRDEANKDEEKARMVAIIIAVVILVVAVILAVLFSFTVARHVERLGRQFDKLSTLEIDTKDLPDPPVFRELVLAHTLFLRFVDRLKLYKSFMPQAIFVDDRDREVSLASLSHATLGQPFPPRSPTRFQHRPSDASDKSEGNPSPVESRHSSAPFHHVRPSKRRKQPALDLGLKSRKASLMMVRGDLYTAEAGQYDQSGHVCIAFVERVLCTIRDYEGVILSISANTILGTWNAHSTYQAHAAQACLCSLAVGHSLGILHLPWWGIVVSTGKCLVGHVGTKERRAPAVLGTPLSLLGVLVHLTAHLRSHILITEPTYELSRDKISARPVDVVPSDPAFFYNEVLCRLHNYDIPRRDTKIYHLVGPAPGTLNFSTYNEAFNCFWRHNFEQALEKLSVHLKDYSYDHHALRLRALSEHANIHHSLPEPYRRRPLLWEDFEMATGQWNKVDEATLTSEGPDHGIGLNGHGYGVAAGSSPSPSGGGDVVSDDRLVNGRTHSPHPDTPVVPGVCAFTNLSLCSKTAAASLRQEIVKEIDRTLSDYNVAPHTPMNKSESTESDEEIEPPRNWSDKQGNVWWRSANSIGKGAHGEVWQAMAQDGTLVALKALPLPTITKHHSPPPFAGRLRSPNLRSPLRPGRFPRRDSGATGNFPTDSLRNDGAQDGTDSGGPPRYEDVQPPSGGGSQLTPFDTGTVSLKPLRRSRGHSPLRSPKCGFAQRAPSMDDENNEGEGSLPTSDHITDEELDEIIMEVEVLSSLRHESIVGYMSSAVASGFVLICMEYVGGGSIQDLINRFGKIPLCSGRRYVKDMVRGLDFLHEKEIIHRDFKPHNVLLSCDGQCKLADFGASAKLQRVTGRTKVIGTPLYMAPEACRGKAVPASDIWGLGITMVQMFTGELPYNISSSFNVFNFMQRLRRSREAADLQLDRLDWTKADLHTRRFVEQCLQWEPDERPTADELLMHAWFDDT